MPKITEVLPCIADPEKIRVIGKLDSEVKEILPYLSRIIPNSYYHESQGWMSFKKGMRIITIYSDGFVTMTMINDEAEALQLLSELEEKIKEVEKNKDQIDLSKPQQTFQITFLDIYKNLPKTNCKACGEETCFIFAAKLLSEERSIYDCKPLWEEEKYFGMRETLLNLLISAGYEIKSL